MSITPRSERPTDTEALCMVASAEGGGRRPRAANVAMTVEEDNLSEASCQYDLDAQSHLSSQYDLESTDVSEGE